MPTPPDPFLRQPAELQRAARRHARAQGNATPWLMPILFVPGLGASRLRLLQAQEWASAGRFDAGLWDPDDLALHRDLYGGSRQGDDAAAEALAQRWLAPREVLREHDGAAVATLQARRWCLPPGQALLPELLAHWQREWATLHQRGWTGLLQAYLPLAAAWSEVPGLPGDPQFLPLAHAHAWDWSHAPDQAAPLLARHIGVLLAQDHLHPASRGWQWPGSPGLVIVAENAGQELVRAALPLCAEGQVLAVYALDDLAPVPARRLLLSQGWQAWQQAALRPSQLAQLAQLAGRQATATPWIRCRHRHAPPAAEVLDCGSSAELCAAVWRHLTQHLLREPATPQGQSLSPFFAARFGLTKFKRSSA